MQRRAPDAGTNGERLDLEIDPVNLVPGDVIFLEAGGRAPVMMMMMIIIIIIIVVVVIIIIIIISSIIYDSYFNT